MTDIAHLQSLERAQETDLKSIEAAVAKATAEIERLDQNLKPEILAERTGEIRRRASEALQERHRAIVERSNEAKALGRKFTPEGVRRSARFHDDPATDATASLAASMRLAKVPTGELLEYLSDAVEANNVAMVEAIRVEWTSRPDTNDLRGEFTARFSKLQIPQAAEAARSLQRVQGLAEMSAVKLTELSRGSSDPMRRLAAFRAAGKPRAA
jgi:hypothetical protein